MRIQEAGRSAAAHHQMAPSASTEAFSGTPRSAWNTTRFQSTDAPRSAGVRATAARYRARYECAHWASSVLVSGRSLIQELSPSGS